MSSNLQCHNTVKSYQVIILKAITSNNQNVFYSNHMNTGQDWYLNGPNLSGCKMILFSNGGLKTGQKSVRKVKCLDFRCYAIQMVTVVFKS